MGKSHVHQRSDVVASFFAVLCSEKDQKLLGLTGRKRDSISCVPLAAGHLNSHKTRAQRSSGFPRFTSEDDVNVQL